MKDLAVSRSRSASVAPDLTVARGAGVALSDRPVGVE